jgi:hypothetical protein
MANGGWYGTKEEWDRIEGPIKSLDPMFEQFARKHDLVVTKNLKEWPERSIRWGNNVRCLMQAFLVDKTSLAVNFWICAYEDRGEGRYWKQEMLRQTVQASDLQNEGEKLLETGKRRLDHWSANPEELELATKLAKWTP